MDFLTEHVAIAETERDENDYDALQLETYRGKSPRKPHQFILEPVKPNPYHFTENSAGATVHYELPETAVVSLELFDHTNRRVRLIASTINTAGRHTVQWDGRDDRGRVLNRGRYLLKFEAAGASGGVCQATQPVMFIPPESCEV